MATNDHIFERPIRWGIVPFRTCSWHVGILYIKKNQMNNIGSVLLVPGKTKTLQFNKINHSAYSEFIVQIRQYLKISMPVAMMLNCHYDTNDYNSNPVVGKSIYILVVAV